MHTITLQIRNDNALKTLQDLETRHLIKIIESSNVNSPALPGEEIEIKEFKNWIRSAEENSTASLIEAKEKWANQRKQLQKLIG